METNREPDSGIEGNDEEVAQPGLLFCFSCGAPRFEPLPLLRGSVEIGRATLAALGIDDDRVSQRHLRVARERDELRVTDLGSTNGSFLDGVRLEPTVSVPASRVARIGRTLVLFSADVAAFVRLGLAVRDGVVVGPQTAVLQRRAGELAAAGHHVLLTGESGSGKEVMARAFHAGSGRGSRPFVAVNCAAIPRELTERLLFGSVRGAFSGATDAPGFFQAADGGTLFLDEVSELDLALQAKLLRAIAEREILPLGSTRAQPVDVRLCAATRRDLRMEVARGAFREDLYYRIGRPEIRIPPLRERPEEIPWLVHRAVGAVPGGAALTVGASFVEACLLRPWPGNVRELISEVRPLAIEALAAGRRELRAPVLGDTAGQHIAAPGEAAPALDAEALREAFEAEGGNLSRAAARLGLPRTTLRRLLEKHGIAGRRSGGDA